MTFSIIKIFKESFTHVWEHKLEWFRVAFAPLVIFFAGLFVMILLLIAAGVDANNMMAGKVAELNLNSVSQTLVIIGNLIYFISLIIAMYGLYINGYRYAVLNEGGGQWWTFHFNMRLVKIILYTILLALIISLYTAIAFGIVLGSGYLVQSTTLNVILGIIFGLYGFYLIFRLSLIFLLISIDKTSPMKTSWVLLKGNVLRLIGLLLLLTIVFLIINFLATGLVLLIGMLGPSGAIVSGILSIFLGIIVWFINWAVGSKAIARVYQALT